MDEATRKALIAYLTAMADDELVLGHRDSEWTGHAPILEEDIAFANLALDEVGHALLWYELVSDLAGEDRETYPDRLVYFRALSDYRSARLVELPKGDWAFTMLRQFLFDCHEKVLNDHLIASAHRPLAEAAAKVRGEELYHRKHSTLWVKRLGLGTAESHQRMGAALDELWGYALGLFEPYPGEEILVSAGIAPDSISRHNDWEALVRPALDEANLIPPEGAKPPLGNRTVHTEHLLSLLDALQSVARSDPKAIW